MIVVGDITMNDFEAAVRKLFGGWKVAEVPKETSGSSYSAANRACTSWINRSAAVNYFSNKCNGTEE